MLVVDLSCQSRLLFRVLFVSFLAVRFHSSSLSLAFLSPQDTIRRYDNLPYLRNIAFSEIATRLGNKILCEEPSLSFFTFFVLPDYKTQIKRISALFKSHPLTCTASCPAIPHAHPNSASIATMHSRTFLTIGLFTAASLAQDYTATASSSAASTTDGSLCDDYATDCSSATSIATSTSSMTTTISYSVTNTSSLLYNLSTTMVTVSTSSTTTYMNSSLTTSTTGMDIPTSILVATGTPVIPSIGSTITSYTIVTPIAAGTATTAPTTQNGSARKAVGISNMALVVLGISSLLLS